MDVRRVNVEEEEAGVGDVIVAEEDVEVGRGEVEETEGLAFPEVQADVKPDEIT